ncbi:MAG: choice-of-anchor I family protein [Bacteroidota bacterium]
MSRLLRLALLLCLAAPVAAQPSLTLDLLGTFATGIFDDGAAEIVDYDPVTQRLFFVNAADTEVVALDVSDPAVPVEAFRVDASAFGGGANSVAVKNGLVALAVEADVAQDPGQVVFFDTDGGFLGAVGVGALPDGLAFSASGRYVVVANEGEPSDDYLADPEGSVSVIDLQNGVGGAVVANATFEAFNEGGPRFGEVEAAGLRIFGPGASVAQDLEPEFVTVEGDETAFVSLQENNGLAEIDLATASVTALYGLGTKNHNLPENALDASNRDDGVNIQSWPVVGYYLPDAVASYQVGGQTYLVTANEGDARDYDAFSEEERVGDLALDPAAFPDAATLQLDENLGRLKITTTAGDVDGDGDFDRLFAYGARSFSIFQPSASGLDLVFDSGDDFEQITAAAFPDDFNATNDENGSFDDRSDDKGPEPEGVAIGEMNGRAYAFIGLERIGGVVTYDVTDPEAPMFMDYTNNRDFAGDAEAGTAGDLGPEGLRFISATDSPTGQPLLVVSNEVSGTVSIFGLAGGTPPAVTIDVEPTATPVVIPAEGGRFAFRALVTNTTGETQSVQAWTEATFPDGSVKQPSGSNDLLGPVTVVLAPGETLARELLQTVPGAIPAGDYVYTARVGAFPDAPISSDSFGGVKVADRQAGTPVAGWRVLDAATGTSVEAGDVWQGAGSVIASSSSVPSVFSLSPAYPNPFRQVTEVALAVPVASEVRVSAFDVLGRRVALLLAGEVEAGTHRVAFDGSGLPSGVYLVRAEAAGFAKAQRVTLVR